MKRKRITAILLASLMGVGSVTAPVQAADSYKETEKAAFAKLIQQIGDEYAESFSELDANQIKGNAEIKVSLDDGGKAILGMLAPVDISWLSDASIDANVGLNENTMTEAMDLKVNGTKICSVEYYMDNAASEIYMKIPEISDSYIKMNLEQMTEQAEEELENTDSSFNVSMDLADAINTYFSSLENLPDKEVVTTLLTRYSDIIFDNTADAENPGVQEAAAGDVGQELTILEGHVTQAEALPMFREILDTAKTDEELKGLIETWTAAMKNPEYTYDTFLGAIEDMEKDLDTEADETDESGFVLRAWVDSEGEVVGRQFCLNDGEQEENLFSYLCTTDGEKNGFSVQFSEGSDSFSLEGNGELSGDLLSGSYTLSTGGEAAAVIDVADYDTQAEKDGIWKGTYTISGAAVEDEDGNSYDPFGGMQLIFTADGKDKNNMDWNLSLAVSGAVLGSISLAGGNEGETLEAVDFASLTDVCDFDSEDDIEKYTASMNLDVLTENLTSAGMPEGWLDDVAALMDTGAEDVSDPETEEQTDMAGDTLDDSEVPAA